MVNTECSKLVLGSQEQVDAFEADFGQEICQRFSGVRSQPVIYEAMPGCDQAFALERLAKQLDVNPQEIMAIGDANNDIEMLEYAGLGVAMSIFQTMSKT